MSITQCGWNSGSLPWHALCGADPPLMLPFWAFSSFQMTKPRSETKSNLMAHWYWASSLFRAGYLTAQCELHARGLYNGIVPCITSVAIHSHPANWPVHFPNEALTSAPNFTWMSPSSLPVTLVWFLALYSESLIRFSDPHNIWKLISLHYLSHCARAFSSLYWHLLEGCDKPPSLAHIGGQALKPTSVFWLQASIQC